MSDAKHILLAFLILLVVGLCCGCSTLEVSWGEVTFRRVTFFYDAKIDEVTVDPEKGVVRLAGYQSESQMALKVAQKALEVVQ